MDYLWTWSGRFVGYREGDDLWNYNGKHVGKFVGKEVYEPNGRYLGELNMDRLITDKNKAPWKRQGPFAPYGRRGAIGRMGDYGPYGMLPGHEDFPRL